MKWKLQLDYLFLPKQTNVSSYQVLKKHQLLWIAFVYTPRALTNIQPASSKQR